jgi:hypothetical protein
MSGGSGSSSKPGGYSTAPANVAMVEDIKNAPSAGVDFMDYVRPGQVINLGTAGSMVLVYLDTCVAETIRGGQVTVGSGQSRVSGGQVKIEQRACQGTPQQVAHNATEAGAAVKRMTPFEQREWQEQIVGGSPIFKWRARGSNPAAVKVYFLDAKEPKLVWEGSTSGDTLAYPKKGPRLQPGMPYLAELTGGARTVFSIDPGIEGAKHATANVVHLR